jgi:Helix-turn-helix domain
VLQAYRFALDPSPAQARLLASQCGAARKAFNEGLARVRRCLDQREAERSYGVPGDLLTEVPWTLPALRRWWNLHKEELAPWWAENSKEAVLQLGAGRAGARPEAVVGQQVGEAARGEGRVSPVQVATPCPGVVPVHDRRDPG